MARTRIKVWLINQYAVPTSMPGITRHFELIKEWEKYSELEVTLWLSSFNYSLRRFLSKDEIKNIETENTNLELKWIWGFPHKLNNWKRMLNMLSFSFLFFLKALVKKKPDIFIASSPQMFVTYGALIISRIFKKQFVLEIRDLWPSSLIAMDGIKPGAVLNVLYMIEKQLYRYSDHIVVLTEHQREYLLKKGVLENKITLIPNGILIDGWEKPKPEILKRFRDEIGLYENDFVAIYTGAHGAANSLDQLVHASKLLAKDEFIILIGDGPEKGKLIKLKERIDANQIYFLDPIPKSEILNFTSIANCGIISLEDNEVFRGARPNKLFDYMFLGIPILSTIGGEVEFILNENGVGFCAKSNDSEDIVEKIRIIRALSAGKLKSISDNGSNYILNSGNRKVSAKIFANIIFELSNKN